MTGRSARLRTSGARLGLVAAAVLAAGCERVTTSVVEADRIEVQPESALVDVDDTTRFTARVVGSAGQSLAGRVVVWRSLDEGTAVVDDGGLVRGLSPGVATIQAASEGTSATARVTVTATQAISLAPTEVELTAAEGGASPAGATIDVTNSGDGALSGLTAAVEHGAGQPAGWLTASLGGTVAPTTLTLTATVGSLPPGTYTAVVRVSSPEARNSPQSVTVALEVTERPPAIGVSPGSVGFSSDASGADPTPLDVAVTNEGGGTLSGLSRTVTYASGQPPGWLSAELDGATAPTTLTLRATRGGLPEGTWAAVIRVTASAASNSPVEIPVSFTVLATRPGAPSGLTATAGSATRIDLSWAFDGFAQAFEVQRAEEGDGFATVHTIESGDARTHRDTGLSQGTTFHYRVRACVTALCSDWSNVATATTQGSSRGR